MTFEEAGQQFAILRQQRDLGQLPDAQFRQLAGQLTVTDAQGAYWQLDPGSGQWMTFNGSAWVAAGQQPQPAYQQPQQVYQQPQQTYQQPAQQQSSWGQIFGDVVSVAGSAAMAAAWYWYSGMAETAPDKRTCIAMLVVPILFIVLRKPIDALLRPLEPFRSKIPPMVLAGCGVAVPFLVANYLYSQGESQFPFMFKTYIYSTLLSFIVLRTPSPAPRPGVM
jgi:drug/metabolite transporter (DMT)-like permease